VEDLVQSLINQVPSLVEIPKTNLLDATSAALVARSMGIIENTAVIKSRLQEANNKKSLASKRHIVNSLEEAEQVNQEELLEAAKEIVEEEQAENPNADATELIKKVRTRRKK
jgi:hypothetical protein